MFIAHLTILAIWLWLWLVFYGWGTLVCQIGRCGRGDAPSLVVNPWIGVGAVVAFVQLWNFAAPLGSWAFVVVSIVGIGSTMLLGLRPARELVAAVRANPWLFAMGFLAVLYLANRSLGSQDYTDNGLYYMNAIRWSSDYAIVPGLANLYNRLGFNNSNFLLHAMLELGTWRGYTGHLINGLLASLTVPIIVPGVRAIVSERGTARQLGWFTVGIAMIVAVTAVDRRISTAHPDFAAALLVSVAAWRFLTFALVEAESTGRLLRWNLLAIVILATTAVTFKTTVIFFAGLAGLSVAVCLHQLQVAQGSRPLWSTVKLLSFMAPWALVIFVPWIVRGYMLSGYPLYPAAVGAAPVDWAFSPKAAADLRQDIYAYARTYYKNIDQGYQPGWGWVPTWFVQVILVRAPVEIVSAAAISLASLSWLVFTRLRAKHDREVVDGHPISVGNLAPLLLALSYFGSLVAWFLTAPSPRMGSFAWWGLAGTLLGLASQTVPDSVFARHRKLVLIGLVGLLLLPTAEQISLVELRYRKNPSMPEFGHHFYSYYPFVLPTGSGGFPPLPQAKFLQKTTDSGLIVNLPELADDGLPGLLWDSPLPSARFFNSRLELRQPNDLRYGFKVTGVDSGDQGSSHIRDSHEAK